MGVRVRRQLIALAFLASSTLAAGADLSKVSRTIGREPAYRHSPRYCLLVFGPDAGRPVWVVLDGETLHVDKNGNGDLTEAAERLPVSRRLASPHPAVAEVRTYYERIPRERLGGRVLPVQPGKEREVWFFSEHYVPRADFRPVTAGEAELRRRLDRGLIRVGFLFDGEFGQTGQAVCANRPADAPVLHFDGPKRLAASAGGILDAGKERPALRRGEDNDLVVHMITPGLGDGAVTVWDNAYVPAGLHPVAELELPGARQGGPPERLTVPLEGRC